MNLLVIEPGLKLWGSERAFLATVPALTDAWERVTVMTPFGSELASALAPFQVDVEPAGIGNLHRAGLLARLFVVGRIVSLCRRHAIDAIYLNQAGMCRLAHLATLLLGIPLIVHVRLAEDVPRCARLRASRRSPISLIFISEDMRQLYPDSRVGQQHKRLVTAYDPFELSEHPPSQERAPSGRFACIGRIAHIKGQVGLVEGLAIAERTQAGLQLDLIGAAVAGDPYEDQLQETIRGCGLRDQVRFLGYRDDVDRLMGQYRFVVVPSLYEPLGRVLFEAWDAAAAPICSASSGGAAEVIAASGGGLSYQGHTPEAIAGALLSAAGMAEPERLSMVERGRKWARQHLSLEAYRAALVGVLFPSRPASKGGHQ